MCPPETEQRCWSPPYWQILAPRLKQCQKLLPDHEHGMYNLEELLFAQEKSWGAWSKLAKPVEAGFFLQGFPTGRRGANSRHRKRTSRTLGVPLFASTANAPPFLILTGRGWNRTFYARTCFPRSYPSAPPSAIHGFCVIRPLKNMSVSVQVRTRGRDMSSLGCRGCGSMTYY